MNRILNLPFFLLLSFIGFCFYKTPGISEAIISVALSCLYGFQVFMDRKFKPQVMTDDMKELQKLQYELEKEKLNVFIRDTKLELSKKSVSNIGGSNDRKKVIF